MLELETIVAIWKIIYILIIFVTIPFVIGAMK